jgi:hypothetical protein
MSTQLPLNYAFRGFQERRFEMTFTTRAHSDSLSTSPVDSTRHFAPHISLVLGNGFSNGMGESKETLDLSNGCIVYGRLTVPRIQVL